MHGREIDVERLVLRPLRLTSDALYTKARSLRGDGERLKEVERDEGEGRHTQTHTHTTQTQTHRHRHRHTRTHTDTHTHRDGLAIPSPLT